MSDSGSRKRPVLDSDEGSDELEIGTFRRTVNRSLTKIPRIGPVETGGFSVRVVPASAGILTPETTTTTTNESDRPSAPSDVSQPDEPGSDVALVPTARRSEQTGKPLCWQGGRLQSILLHDTFSQSGPVGRSALSGSFQGGATVRTITARSTLPDLTAFRPSQRSLGSSNRQRGRPRKYNRHGSARSDVSSDQETGVGGPRSDVPVTNMPVRGHNRKSGRPETEPPSLLLPLREHHTPTDMSLPALDVTAKYDPFSAIVADTKSAECPTPVTTSGAGQAEEASAAANAAPSTTGQPSGSATIPVRMKSSGSSADIDPQELRGYRRLNGYQLFVMVNKKKHGSALTTAGVEDAAEPVETQRDLHRKWQAIWSTLPEKTRKEWKTKARRLMKQSGQLQSHAGSHTGPAGKRSGWSKDRTQAEIRKIENQLARSDGVSTNLLEYAAYFQLLSDSFASAARNLSGFDGPVSPESVETILLDGLLSCMIPLLALASEEEILSDVPDKRDVSRGLRNLTYLLPT